MRNLGWGLFLASSWTWCIGMFLPVIMLRDYGWLGFLAFAVPNVVGCTIFGWCMPPERGRRLLARAGWVAALFSVVTIAYHLFFTGFAARMLAGDWLRTGAVGSLQLIAGVLLAAGALSFLKRDLWPWLGGVVWILSVGCWIGAASSAAVSTEPASARSAWGLSQWSWTGTSPTSDLLSIGWPLLFGFLWSPWFDLSFHRARREAGSPRAFAVFAAAFAAMLLFTAAYAGEAGNFGPWILLHLGAQSIFTVAVHLRELREAGDPATRPHGWPSPSVLLPTAALWGLAGLIGATLPSEASYLRFLVFYGLVVPAVGMALVAPRALQSDRRILPLMALLILGGVLLEVAFIQGFPLLAWIPFPPLILLAVWTPGGRGASCDASLLRRACRVSLAPLQR